MRRLGGIVLAIAVFLTVAATAPVRADDAGTEQSASEATSIEGGALPSSARPGQRVQAWSAGWPASTQVQGVVCGDLAIGGSGTCDLAGAVVARTDREGALALDVVLSRPPRPCPCVIRISTFDGPALSFNIPVHVIGHRTGTPPVAVEPVADLQLGEIRFADRDTPRALLGLGGGARLVVSVVNRGDAPARVPELAYGVGGGDATLDRTVSPDLEVPPGQRRDVVIEVSTPPIAFGSYQGAVQWADGTGPVATAPLTVYPWAVLVLFLALVLAGVVLAWVSKRRAGRAHRGSRARRSTAGDPYPLPDVVYLEGLQGYLVNPRLLRHSRIPKRVAGRLTAYDLVALAQGGAIVAPAVVPPPETISLLDDDDRELDDVRHR